MIIFSVISWAITFGRLKFYWWRQSYSPSCLRKVKCLAWCQSVSFGCFSIQKWVLLNFIIDGVLSTRFLIGWGMHSNDFAFFKNLKNQQFSLDQIVWSLATDSCQTFAVKVRLVFQNEITVRTFVESLKIISKWKFFQTLDQSLPRNSFWNTF